MRDNPEITIIYLLAGIFIIFSLGLLIGVEMDTDGTVWWILTLLLAYTIIKRKD